MLYVKCNGPISDARKLWLFQFNILKKKEDRRKLLKSKRDKWIEKHGPCVKCGSSKDLEIDHIDPNTKSFNINWGRQSNILKLELAKCQVLCRACHGKKSGLERLGTTHKKHKKHKIRMDR